MQTIQNAECISVSVYAGCMYVVKDAHSEDRLFFSLYSEREERERLSERESESAELMSYSTQECA